MKENTVDIVAITVSINDAREHRALDETSRTL